MSSKPKMLIDDRLKKLVGHEIILYMVHSDGDTRDYTSILESIDDDTIVLKQFDVFGQQRSQIINRHAYTLLSVEDLGIWRGKK